MISRIYKRVEHILAIKVIMDSNAHLQLIANAIGRSVEELKELGRLDDAKRTASRIIRKVA